MPLALPSGPATSKTHVSRAMLKLGAHDRAQLVVVAFHAGLAAPRAEAGAPHAPALGWPSRRAVRCARSATSRVSSRVPKPGMGSRSATPHEPRRAGPVDAG